MGVQTALEGASMAENKCSALGGELVKLFRMIATTRKESPSKMMMMMDGTAGVDELNNEQLRTQQQHHHHQQQPPPRSGRSIAVKSKGQTACNYCKKATTKGNSGDSNLEGGRGDCGHNHAGFQEAYPSTTDGNRMSNFYNNEAGDIEQRSPEGFERSLKACNVHGKQSLQHHGTSRDVSPAFKITKHQLQKDKDEPTRLDSMWKRATSEGRILEGKLPITLDERREDSEKKLEGVQISTGKPELQLTNIRLEAGKVHVNVSHRPPSSLMGVRGMKRGDAMSAAQP